jgi:hypothetical protein
MAVRVPALLVVLQREGERIRKQVIESLWEIDPEAAAQIDEG